MSFCGKIFEFIMMILCSAHISGESTLEHDIVFPHGGLGVVIHPSASVGAMSIINTNVTIGNAFPHIQGVPVIGNHVYIGTGAFIGGNISISDYVIIGANSVVTKNIGQKYVVVAGNPAKIKRSLTAEEIEMLNWK